MENLKVNNFKEKFETAMKEERPIYNKDGQQLMLEADEYFKQCYSPDKSGRNELPQYWFLSNKEHLISVEKKEPRWLSDDAESRNGRGRYQFVKEDGLRESVEAATLQALVFDSYIFGEDAKRLLKEKGLKAFGRVDNPVALNTHHIEGKGNEAAEQLEIVKSLVHIPLHKNPKTEHEKIEHMLELAEVATKEAPEKIVYVSDGIVMDRETGEWSDDGRIEIRDDVQISFSEDGFKSLQALFCNVPVKIDTTK